GVRHPHTANKLRFLAYFFEHVADLRATAMHDDRIETNLFHECDITGKAGFQTLVGHGVAAVLDHDGLAGKTLNIGQRLTQNAGHPRGRFLIQKHASAVLHYAVPVEPNPPSPRMLSSKASTASSSATTTGTISNC